MCEEQESNKVKRESYSMSAIVSNGSSSSTEGVKEVKRSEVNTGPVSAG